LKAGTADFFDNELKNECRVFANKESSQRIAAVLPGKNRMINGRQKQGLFVF